jgi:hypothetical protein
MDAAQWDGSDSANSVLGEYTYMQQVDSAPASQFGGYDRDTYIGSPQSETTHDFETMSSLMTMGMHHTPGADTPPSSEEGQDDSDDILDGYLINVEPRDDRRYHCADVRADDHSCNFVSERRCMLRCVGPPPSRKLSNHPASSKHLEQTLKTNVCHHPACKGQAFSSKAVLTRHEREAHSMHQAMQYYCPDHACERATRGFAREYNMADHIARVHKELDASQFLKKSKRTKKGSSSSAGSTVVEAKPSSSSRRGSGKPSRRQQQSQAQQQQHHFERQFIESHENAAGLWSQMQDPRNPETIKYIHRIKGELRGLEDAYNHIHSNGAHGND